MQGYAYEAFDVSGQLLRGSLVAASRREAMEGLSGRGLHVVQLREQTARTPTLGVGRLLRRHRFPLVIVTRQLATLCGAGVPLVQSMDVLIEQSDDPGAKAVLSDILESVKAGRSLSDALGDHQDVFPEVMISMVRMGEVSGTLDEVLARLAELFERQVEIRGEVRAALAYPTLVLLLGVASAVVLLTVVVPSLEVMFEGLGERLPLPTRILCGISAVVSAGWWAIALALVAVLLAVRAASKRSSLRLAWDRAKLRIPWVGRLIRQVAIARFARALGTLVHGDVAIVEALDVARAAAGNAAIAAKISEMGRQIEAGHSLAALMRAGGVFPPMPVQMVAVGEETGRLDQMLLSVAEAYERDTAASTRMITSLLAPALILCVALVVAFIILSLVLPIFQLSAGIR